MNDDRLHHADNALKDAQMHRSRLQAALDDARIYIADIEEDGRPVVHDIQYIRDKRELEQIHTEINHVIRRVQALKGGKSA